MWIVLIIVVMFALVPLGMALNNWIDPIDPSDDPYV